MSDEPVTGVLAHTDQGSGPAVVLIPGLTFNRRSWDPIIERVADRLRCIAIDLPGHGESTGTLSPWAVPPLLAALLQRLDIDRPVVVGHSLGAAVALGHAAQFPTRGVVAVDQPVDLRALAETARAIAPTLAGPGFEQAWTMVRQHIGRDQVAEPLRSRLIAEDEARPELVAGYWGDLITDPGALQTRPDGLLARITVPVLALFGHESDAAAHTAYRARLPGADVLVEEWPGAGHCLHLVNPVRFAERLVTFVGALP